MKNKTMGNQQATQAEIGWLAGIIDGEGYLGIQVAKRLRRKGPSDQVTAALSITNTDEKIVLEAASILKKLGIDCRLRVNKAMLTGNHKVVYSVGFRRRKKLIRFLPRVIRHLAGNKKERAKLILAFCKSREKSWIPGKHSHPFSEKELELIDKCRSLQKRGASETIRKAQLENSKIRAIEAESQRRERQSTMLTYPCAECGNLITDSPSRFKDHSHYFCNQDCRVAYQRKHSREYQAVMI